MQNLFKTVIYEALMLSSFVEACKRGRINSGNKNETRHKENPTNTKRHFSTLCKHRLSTSAASPLRASWRWCRQFCLVERQRDEGERERGREVTWVRRRWEGAGAPWVGSRRGSVPQLPWQVNPDLQQGRKCQRADVRTAACLPSHSSPNLTLTSSAWSSAVVQPGVNHNPGADHHYRLSGSVCAWTEPLSRLCPALSTCLPWSLIRHLIYLDWADRVGQKCSTRCSFWLISLDLRVLLSPPPPPTFPCQCARLDFGPPELDLCYFTEGPGITPLYVETITTEEDPYWKASLLPGLECLSVNNSTMKCTFVLILYENVMFTTGEEEKHKRKSWKGGVALCVPQPRLN